MSGILLSWGSPSQNIIFNERDRSIVGSLSQNIIFNERDRSIVGSLSQNIIFNERDRSIVGSLSQILCKFADRWQESSKLKQDTT